jgi:hypothetical protein
VQQAAKCAGSYLMLFVSTVRASALGGGGCCECSRQQMVQPVCAGLGHTVAGHIVCKLSTNWLIYINFPSFSTSGMFCLVLSER